MDDFLNIQNKAILVLACSKMLKEKYNITLTDENLNNLLDENIKEIVKECSDMDLKLNELNNLILSKIKTNIYKKIIATSPSKKRDTSIVYSDSDASLNNSIQNSPSEDTSPQSVNNTTIKQVLEDNDCILDNDLISYKLKQLEMRRNTTQNIPRDLPNYTQTFDSGVDNSIRNKKSYNNQVPLSINIPPAEKPKMYKNFIINSLNRDWHNNPSRNNIKFNISIDMKNNIFYPECICFPAFVKNITPYILMMLSDGVKNIFYTFTVSAASGNKWDIWKPFDNTDNIILNNKSWQVKFYDFTNQELDLGNDNTVIQKVNYENNDINLLIYLEDDSIENNFYTNDMVYIQINNKKNISKKIKNYKKIEDNVYSMLIENSNNNLKLEDFIDSKILNLNNQYTFIIKYTYSL